MSDRQAQSDLIAAANIIRDRGWIQGAYETKHGVCLARALDIATRNRSGALLQAASVVRAYICYSSVSGWNDLPGRTEEQVIAALYGSAGVTLNGGER